jgi:thymidine kinase
MTSGQLTMIVGPMMSGKSFDVVAIFAPLQHTDAVVRLYQPQLNIRDAKIQSRVGIGIAADKIASLNEIPMVGLTHVGIDEIHMFDVSEAEVIQKLLLNGVDVVVSGLDMDYRGTMFAIVKKLFELAPKEVRYKRAVCYQCRKLEAAYTQIFHRGTPVTQGLPAVVPEDGTYEYKPTCRRCFVREPAEIPAEW